MLRRGRRARSSSTPSGQSIRAAFAALFGANDGMYEAVVGSNVLTDRVNGSRTFAAGAGVIPAATADVGFGGKPVLLTDGSTNHLLSNQTAAYWKRLNDGTGSTLVYVHELTNNTNVANREILATCGIDPGYAGRVLFAQNNTASFTDWIVNASGSTSVSTGVVPHTQAPSYFDISLMSGASGYVFRRKSSALYTATPGALSSASPLHALRIGASLGTPTPSSQKTRALYYWDRVLTAAERNLVQRYIQLDTGIAP